MLQLFQNHRVNRTRIELRAGCELPGLDDGKMVTAPIWSAKGWQLYFQNYLNTLTLAEHQIVERLLPAATDWFILAGILDMIAMADDKKAFMVGGIGAANEWRIAA